MHKTCNPDLAAHTTHRTKPALGSHQSTLRRMCQLYSAGLPPQRLFELQFRDRLCIDTRLVPQPIMPGFYGSAHLVHRCVHSHPHRVAARLQFCSANLHLFLHNLAGSPHRRQILMVGDCMVQPTHKLGIADAA